MAKRYRCDNDTENENEHPWAASSRYPDDDNLRANGFKIHTRIRIRGKLMASWERNGVVYSEREALDLIAGNSGESPT